MRRLPVLAPALVATGVALALAPEPLRIALEYDRAALAAGEWWRAWSGHVVHFSARHAGVDLAAVLTLAAVIETRCGPRTLAAMLLCLSPLLSLSLYFGAPDLAIYRGASGLCAALAATVGLLLWEESAVMRAPLIGLAGLFALKTLCEAFGFAANASGLGGAVRVVWQAHAFGAACGIAAFALLHCRKPTQPDRFKKIVMPRQGRAC